MLRYPTHLVFCVALLASAGCARTAAAQDQPAPSGGGVSQATLNAAGNLSSSAEASLRSDLEDLDTKIVDTIRSTYRQALPQTSTDQQKSTLKAWRTYLIDQTNRAVDHDDPKTAMLDLWAAFAQVRRSLNDKQSQDQLGPVYESVYNATQGIYGDIDSLVQQYLPEDAYKKAGQSIDAFAQNKEFSITALPGDVAGAIKDNAFSLFDVGKSTLSSIASVPLMPGKAVNSVAQGVDQIGNINETAKQFTNVVQNLPEQTRKQIELLLQQIEDQKTTLTQMLESTRQTADSIAGAARQSSELTTGVNRVLLTGRDAAPEYQRLVEAVDKATQSSTKLVNAIHQLMPEKKPGAATADAATSGSGKGFDPVEYRNAALAIQQGSAEVTRTIQEIEQLIAQTKSDEKDKPPSPDHHPFDIRDYRDTAQALGQASAQLNALLEQVDRQLRSGDLNKTVGALQQQVKPTLDESAATLQNVIDHAAWRIGELIVLAFVLAALLLVLRWLLARRRG